MHMTGDNLTASMLPTIVGGRESITFANVAGYQWFPQFQQNMGMSVLLDSTGY